ncbi:MAG: putative ornithine carbamoyltransferase protein [Osedax symbiont Rs1]|nr:MAG: putative ornithine carbamoyltransferase protein [Osedax symbiont Rs1]
MLKLLDIDDLTKADIYKIWRNIRENLNRDVTANIGWSFAGNGIRTRTTFIQAFQNLGINYVELPNFLQTGESVQDLAGYMDSFYSMYVIRETNHQRLQEFAAATTRPVINAMSAEAHPCEVLTDAYYLATRYESLPQLRILLWGPVTNVFTSWHSLAKVLDLNITQCCPREYHLEKKGIVYTDKFSGEYDVLVTDAWPAGFSDQNYCLTEHKLRELGSPIVLPTPPVTVGNELSKSLCQTENFVGYQQKALLLPVQIQIIAYLLESL